MKDNISIEVPTDHALYGHIVKLEQALTKRNRQIEELKARLSSKGESEAMQRARKKAYQEGYKAAAGTLMEATRKFTDVLNAVNQQSFQTWLEGERIGWGQ